MTSNNRIILTLFIVSIIYWVFEVEQMNILLLQETDSSARLTPASAPSHRVWDISIQTNEILNGTNSLQTSAHNSWQ